MNDLRVYLICEVAPCSLNDLLSNTIITSNFAYNISRFFFIFMLCLCIWHLSNLSYCFFSVSFPQNQKRDFLQLSYLMTFIVFISYDLFTFFKKSKIMHEVLQILLNSSATAGCESTKYHWQNFKAIDLYWST